jgi:UDP-N-acetylglucosamine 2-epimerase (hydrolysing)
MNRKKIIFLTGTRADFGKLKSLIKITQESNGFEIHIFATGMHLNPLYGATVNEIEKSGFKNIYKYINHDEIEHMDRTLAKTIDGFSHYVKLIDPDLIVVHGDRVEALAGAIVGSLNNILVAHIEGGEISGTVDELIRHSVSKLSHVHFVAKEEAKKRLIQMGEIEESIFVIGSPDLDLMNSKNLPLLEEAKKYYNIEFKDYAIAMFHPVTTEYDKIQKYAKDFVDALIDSNFNYVVIYPNNDMGSIEILNEYKRLQNKQKFKLFPSLRFEYFLVLLKNAKFMIGNSSAGIREAPYYNVPSIDIGTRQNNRAKIDSIIHCVYKKEAILCAIEKVKNLKLDKIQKNYFGDGNSDKIFFEIIDSNKIWNISCQKQFCDRSIN